MSQSSQPQPSTSIPLHPRPLSSPSPNVSSPLPTLLQTPSGLALLELQGTINIPAASAPPSQPQQRAGQSQNQSPIPIGRLHFPDYRPGITSENDTAWMKRVWMYIGGTQRLQGEVKKLPKPVAVVRRRGCRGDGDGKESGNGEEGGDVQELEVVEIVKWQVVFRSRPEPVVEGIEL